MDLILLSRTSLRLSGRLSAAGSASLIGQGKPTADGFARKPETGSAVERAFQHVSEAYQGEPCEAGLSEVRPAVGFPSSSDGSRPRGRPHEVPDSSAKGAAATRHTKRSRAQRATRRRRAGTSATRHWAIW